MTVDSLPEDSSPPRRFAGELVREIICTQPVHAQLTTRDVSKIYAEHGGGLTCVPRHELLSDDGHSAGSGGGGVEAAAVGAVGCICAIGTSITLLVVGASVQAPALVGCRVTGQN